MRTSVTVTLAAAFGALLGYFGATRNTGEAVIKTVPITVPAPLDITLLSEEDARQQRANNYQSVRGMADVLSLPTLFAQTEALVALAARLDIDAIAELIAAARGVGSESTRLQLLSILLSRFAELNTPLALEYLQSSGLATQDPQLLGVLFSPWAKTDLNAALHGVRQLGNHEHIQIAGDAILQAHKEHGKEFAENIVAQLPRQYSVELYEIETLAQRADNDPAAAFSEAQLIEDPQRRFAAMHSVFEKWAQQDVQAAASQLLELQNSELKHSLQYSIVQKLAEQDPEAALEWITNNTEGDLRDNMLQAALSQIVQENPEQAIAYLDKLPTSQRDSAAMSVAMSWAMRDPEAAVDWVAKQDLKHDYGTLSMLAQTWTERDPEAAGRYIENLPAPAKSEWLASVAQGYARNDPAAALKWLQQYKAEPGYSNALDNALSEWSSSDPQAVLAFVERQPDKAQLPNAVINAVSRLAQENLPDAVATVETLPEGKLRQAATGALVQQWRGDDTPGLDNWIAGLDSGPSRDRAIETLITRLGGRSERAITLINSLQSEESRVRSGTQLLYMTGADAEKARELMAQLNLPEDKRQEIIDTVRQYQDPSPSAVPFGVFGIEER